MILNVYPSKISATAASSSTVLGSIVEVDVYLLTALLEGIRGVDVW
jgi:hypothetical protein